MFPALTVHVSAPVVSPNFHTSAVRFAPRVSVVLATISTLLKSTVSPATGAGTLPRIQLAAVVQLCALPAVCTQVLAGMASERNSTAAMLMLTLLPVTVVKVGVTVLGVATWM